MRDGSSPEHTSDALRMKSRRGTAQLTPSFAGPWVAAWAAVVCNAAKLAEKKVLRGRFEGRIIAPGACARS